MLEIGPHFGAFLQVATEWGWSGEGVDIGKDTAAYLTGRGYRIHNCAIQDCGLDPESFDAVFIWNCFEQIEDPHTTLVECRRVLKRGGALLLRTPNARYFEACEQFSSCRWREWLQIRGRQFHLVGLDNRGQKIRKLRDMGQQRQYHQRAAVGENLRLLV